MRKPAGWEGDRRVLRGSRGRVAAPGGPGPPRWSSGGTRACVPSRPRTPPAPPGSFSRPPPEPQGSQRGNPRPWGGREGERVGLRPSAGKPSEAGPCPLGVVSRGKEGLGSSLVSPLAVWGAVVFVWERCRPTVAVVCLCARVGTCGCEILPLMKCGGSRWCCVRNKAQTNKVLVAGV